MNRVELNIWLDRYKLNLLIACACTLLYYTILYGIVLCCVLNWDRKGRCDGRGKGEGGRGKGKEGRKGGRKEEYNFVFSISWVCRD